MQRAAHQRTTPYHVTNRSGPQTAKVCLTASYPTQPCSTGAKQIKPCRITPRQTVYRKVCLTLSIHTTTYPTEAVPSRPLSIAADRTINRKVCLTVPYRSCPVLTAPELTVPLHTLKHTSSRTARGYLATSKRATVKRPKRGRQSPTPQVLPANVRTSWSSAG